MTTDTVKVVSTRFEKGKSGNPAGRPKGSKNAITLLKQSLELQLREQAAPDLGGVLDKCMELALDGDRQMIKLLLELHMSKGIAEETARPERVAIQINSHAPAVVEVIEVVTPPTEEEDNVDTQTG